MHGATGLEPASPYVRWGNISNLVLDMARCPVTITALRLSNALLGTGMGLLPGSASRRRIY